ncbi:DUF917 domain-containing protein [Paramicrobacterium chengjingii]|uniref:DUF917 domain-containing protein n=1 Tax=Paramicrobacterium chengjingii TaxID=2769067 RepID=A0ABX6YHV4_9MICO|nr:DUF917 domain-containing protein [Microbacterium chengjingii]QPZ38396.1 DUF917 domain-containing protein [Microbacterium chengjingii]
MELTADAIRHLRSGALFLACAADHDWCHEQMDRILSHMAKHETTATLQAVDEFDDDALIVAVGFVNSGLPLSDLQPVGDEFLTSLRLVEESLGRPTAALMPLAAANINSLVPVLTGMQTGVPVVDADPMGRVFPLLYQSVFTLAGLSAGPIGATGPLGDSALLDVEDPHRAERLVRALAGEFGGWSATALYPMRAKTLALNGILGSVSRMIHIGEILDSRLSTRAKHDSLRRDAGVKRIIRARVSDITGLSRPAPPGQPDMPSSVVLIEESQERIVQIEIQNELLMVMIDGAVVAVIPDIITMLRPEDASVASLDDLWVGNMLDIVVLPAAPQWYSPEGTALVGPDALHLWLRSQGGR